MPATDLEQIVNLCKRRGFVYPTAEIYGGGQSEREKGDGGGDQAHGAALARLTTG